MATREFNGTTDYLHCGGTGVDLADIANAYSIVALVKPLVVATSGTLVSCARTTSVSPIAEMSEGSGGTGTLDHYNYLDGTVGENVGVAASAWQILGVDKSAGDSVFPRVHRLTLGGTTSHLNATVDVGSQPTDLWTITQFGRRGTGTNYMNYRIAVAAVFDYQLADGNYDTMKSSASTASIADLLPVALWEFNQASVATDVLDLVGSADQVAISGTTAASDDPTWTFGLGDQPTLRVTRSNMRW